MSPRLLVRALAVAALCALSRPADGARTLVGIHSALEAKSAAQPAQSVKRSGAPDMRTVMETVLRDPPNVMDPKATEDVLNYCLESGFNCSRAVEWRRKCYEVLSDPITGPPRSHQGKSHTKELDRVCLEDPVSLDEEGKIHAACRKAYVCVNMQTRTYVVGNDGKKVGDSYQHCDHMHHVTTYKACVPDWQPDSQDVLRNPAMHVVTPLPLAKLPERVEEVISEFIPFFGADWEPEATATTAPPSVVVDQPAVETPVTPVTVPVKEDTVIRHVETHLREARCVCNDDATRAVLLETQDRLLGKSLFVGSNGLMAGHAPKIDLKSETPCACLEEFYNRRPWSWFAPDDQCTDAPAFWDPTTESNQIWLREKEKHPSGEVTWFDDCHKLCQSPQLLTRVDIACDLGENEF